MVAINPVDGPCDRKNSQNWFSFMGSIALHLMGRSSLWPFCRPGWRCSGFEAEVLDQAFNDSTGDPHVHRAIDVGNANL